MSQFISVKKDWQQTNKHAPMAIMLCLLLLFSFFNFSFADSSLPLTDLVFVEITNSNNVTYNNGVVTSNNGSGVVLFAFGNYDIPSGSAITLTGTIPILTNDSDYSNIGFRLVKDDKSTVITSIASIYPIHKTDTEVTVNATFTYTDEVAYIGVATNSHKYSFDLSNVVLEGVPSSSGGGITNNGNAIIVVNPGNAAYIGYDSADFTFLINLSKPVRIYNSNARYGFASQLPNGSISFTPSTGNPLPLSKSIPDILGRAATWVGSVNTDTIGYLVVYNPVYDYNGNTNPPIRVTVTVGYMNVTQFPLTATDVGGEIISTGSTDNFYISDGMQGGTDLPYYIYSQTNNGVISTSSALTVPVTPYNYTTPSTGSAESGLQGFIQQILDLLSAPVQHIQNLYNSAIAFFGVLTSLWDWLPPELVSIMFSALVVLVVIGVVKFLWK